MERIDPHGTETLRPTKAEALYFGSPHIPLSSLEEIFAMDDTMLDAKLAEHLDGQSPFDSEQVYKNNPEKRRHLKRLFLALLSGFHKGYDKLIDLYDPDFEYQEPKKVMGSRVKLYASEAFKARLKVAKKLARESFAVAPDNLETLKLLRSIGTTLVRRGIIDANPHDIGVLDILNPDALPNHLDLPRLNQEDEVSINYILRLYLQVLQEVDKDSMRDLTGFSIRSIRNTLVKYCTKNAFEWVEAYFAERSPINKSV